MRSIGRDSKHNRMKQTYEDIIIGILLEADRPMRARDLISEFRYHFNPAIKPGTIRQTLMIARYKSLLCLVKLDGFPGFYCLPSWFQGPWLKENYKQKIYEGKRISFQKPAGSMGRPA